MATKYSTATSRNCSLLSSSSPPEPEPEPRPKPTSMNPTATTKHHRTPPCTTTTTTTVQNISSQFARLYANHKNQKLAEKDASCPTLTKSNSQKPADSRRKKEKKSDVLDAEKALAKKRFDDFKVKKVFDPYQYGSLALDRGRRKSFSCSQNELVNILSCSGVKVVAVDMPPFMQIHAVDCARKTHDSLEKFTSKALALTLKKEFDGVYGPAWHCIVGTSFGSFVTHSVGGFMYFSMDHKLYILLFKTTVQRAD